MGVAVARFARTPLLAAIAACQVASAAPASDADTCERATAAFMKFLGSSDPKLRAENIKSCHADIDRKRPMYECLAATLATDGHGFTACLDLPDLPPPHVSQPAPSEATCQTAVANMARILHMKDGDRAGMLANCRTAADDRQRAMLACAASATNETGLDRCLELDGSEPDPSSIGIELPAEVSTVFDHVELTSRTKIAVGAIGPSPATCCTRPHKACDDHDLSAPLWRAIGMPRDARFPMPYRFSYAYRGTAKSFELTATGEEDCDGDRATFVLEGAMTDGKLAVHLRSPR